MEPTNKNTIIPPISSPIQHRRTMLFTSSLKIWLIVGGFVIIMLAVVLAVVFTLNHNTDNKNVSQYSQQKLSSDAIKNLKNQTPKPEDYLLSANPITLGIPTTTSNIVNNNISKTYVSTQQITNNAYSTTEMVTNNSYSTTEMVTNNVTNITEVTNAIVLLAGEGIAVSEIDGKYTISSVGTANTSLSNLSTVALNTSLLPGVNGSLDIGSSSVAFQNGYFNGMVRASSLNSLSGGTLSIGSASSGVVLNADTSVASGKTLSAGKLTVKSQTNQAGTFEVQQASGAAVLSIDTSTARVGVGTSTPTNKLSIGTPTTANSTAQVVIASGGSSNKGLVVQASTSAQSAKLVEIQASDGSLLTGIGATGITTSGYISATGIIYTVGGISSAGNVVVSGAVTANSLSATGAASVGSLSTTGVAKIAASDNNALLVQSTVGSQVLNVNTTNARVEVGAFIPTTLWVKPPITTYPSSLVSASANLRNTVVDDFNGDGWKDYIVAGYTPASVYVYINQGNGAFSSSPVAYTSVATALDDHKDVNGDGRPDLLFEGPYVMLNNGSGGFLAPVSYGVGSGSARFADMNGDSWSDLVYSSGAGMAVRLNNHNGTFGSAISTSFPQITGIIADIEVADFNKDGRQDIAAVDRITNKLSIINGNGSGGLSVASQYVVPNVNYAYYDAIGDFNGDGWPDVVAGGLAGPDFVVYLNLGNGLMGAPRSYKYDAVGYINYIDTGKFTHSGRDDIVITDSRAKTVNIMLSNTDGSLSQPAVYSNPLNVNAYAGVAYSDGGDMNNDGIDDLAVSDVNAYTSVMIMTVFASHDTVAPSAKLLVSVNSDEAGQVIKGNSGQTADYLRVIDNFENPVMVLNSSGDLSLTGGLSVEGVSSFQAAANIRTTTDSANGFRVQNAVGATAFNVNTSQNRISINTANSDNTLAVNALTTADSYAQVAIGTQSAASKGLIVQGINGQTGDLIQAQSSNGTVLARISSTGALSVMSAMVSGNLSINNGGHVIISGSVPTFTAATAACSSPSIVITGSDTSGVIVITTGTGCTVSGTLLTMNFRLAYASAPRVMLSPANAAAAGLSIYSGASSISDCTIDTLAIPQSGTVYKLNYWVVQ